MTAYAEMDDVKEWATIAWSFLAQPPGGWTQVDEENWDTAVGIIVDGMSRAGSEEKKDGKLTVPMTATAAVFKK